jgi:putative spermidine/putrescine transport system permease protein
MTRAARPASWAVMTFLVLPLAAIVPMSFSGTRYLSLPSGGLSLVHYETLLADPSWHTSLLHSLWLALPAAVLAVLLGTAFCLGAWQRQGGAVRLLQVLMLGPLIVPGIIHAVAYHRALSLVGLFDTFTGTVIVHAVKGLPYVVLSVTASLSAVHPGSLQLARSFGASTWQGLWRVVLPQVRAGVATGFVFAFVTSWDEIVVTLFITSRRVHTLPRQVWEGLFLNLDPVVAALGTLALLLTLLSIAMLFVRGGRVPTVH